MSFSDFWSDIKGDLVNANKFFRSLRVQFCKTVLINPIKNALKNPDNGKFMSHDYKGEKGSGLMVLYIGFEYDNKENLFAFVSFYQNDYQ